MADFISINDLGEITADIMANSDKIHFAYTEKVVKGLERAQNELKVSGVNYDEIQETMKKLFTNLTTQLNELTDAMTNTIIPKYEATTNVINRMFNQEFANEINDCLATINAE